MIKPNMREFLHSVFLAHMVKTFDRLAKRQKGTKARIETMRMARGVASLIRECANEALRGE